MIEINGAFGEGGGQILRTSLSLSALTGKPLRIHHIRANRKKPGLRPQHLAAVKAIGKITSAYLKGDSIDSTEVILTPSGVKSGRFKFDVYTAGSLSLVIQTIFLPLSFASGRSLVNLTGGTHVNWSPIFHYLQKQWFPLMADLGFRVEYSLKKAGFYPTGGGEAQIKVLPASTLRPYTCVDRGDIRRIRGLSGVANLDDSIAVRQKHQALKCLYKICQDSKIKTCRLPSRSKGTFILIKAEFSNGSSACYTALGAAGKPAEAVADEAVDQLLSFLNTDGCIDQFLADQILLPLSIIDGVSKFRTNAVTQHLLTNAHVIQQFMPIEIAIDGELNKPGLITVCGSSDQINKI